MDVATVIAPPPPLQTQTPNTHILVISCIPEFGVKAATSLAECVKKALLSRLPAPPHVVAPPSPPPPIVETLVGSQASKTAVLGAIKRVAAFTAGGENRRGWVYYSGHGDQTRDAAGGDETVDHLDEFWKLPSGGALLDDEITAALVQTPTRKTSLNIFISDSCSSGTMIDANPSSSNTNWVLISACRDNENALATFDGGVFTMFGLIPALTTIKTPLTAAELFRGIKIDIPDQHVSLHSSRPDIASSLPLFV